MSRPAWDERAERLFQRARELAGEDDLTARLLFVSLTEHLVGGDPTFIVVGGTAVDTYVGGAFGTSEGYPAGWRESLDVDTIAMSTVPGNQKAVLRERLEDCGFEPSPTGGSFSLEEIPYVLDIVSRQMPDDYSMEHAIEVRLDVENLDPPPVKLVGPEDLLFDYLESAVATNHQRDWARALAIANVMADTMDLGYLYTKAHWRLDGEFVEDLDRLLAGEPLSVA